MIELSTKVISPIALTDAILISSTAPETDYAVWAAATAYTLGQKCIRVSTHRIYERLIAGTTATPPETDPTNWLDIGPTNRWAMFDNVVGTATTITTPLTVVLKPGSISGLALLELVGKTATITMKESTGGAVAYNKVVTLDGTIITSFYDWFYTPYAQEESVALTDLPFHFPNCELTVSISSTSGSVSCGVCKFGEVIGIGATEYGATSGAIDYSVKTVDAFGRYTIVKRGYSKKMSLKVITEQVDYPRISRALADLRATPAVWIATDVYGYEPLTVYGFYKEFSIEVAYPTMNYCSLEIEGLI